MSILVNKDTKVLVQGFTGKNGSFHSQQAIAYGTKIVGGVTPGKGGQTHLGLPVFNTMREAMVETKADASVLYVPAPFVLDSVIEAVDAGIKLVVVITEGVPILDMLQAKRYIETTGSARLIGPNCPGIITSDEAKIGIMPGFVFKKGKVGIVSKSGTLTYEAADQVVKAGYGVSTAIGIGGDPIIGTTTKEALELFINDPETEAVVMIGEIGGSLEAEAASRSSRDLSLNALSGRRVPARRC